MRVGGTGQTRTGNTLLFKQVLYAIGATDPLLWYPELDSNQRPTPYQDGALPLCYPGIVVDPRGGIEPP